MIAREMRERGYKVDWIAIEKKWRNLKKTYITNRDKRMNKTGCGQITWEFFDKLDEIYSRDAAICPPVLCSSLPLPKIDVVDGDLVTASTSNELLLEDEYPTPSKKSKRSTGKGTSAIMEEIKELISR